MLGAAVRVPHNSPMTPESNSSAAARARAAEICRALAERGFAAYFVGGCVRDLLLGREPADYDVATERNAEQVEEIFPGSLTVGAQFGVVIVPSEQAQIEVATFRSDIGYSDGRHPDNVVFTSTPEQDARAPRLHDQRNVHGPSEQSKCLISLAAKGICTQESFARSAIRSSGSRKTNFGWRARCDLPRDSDTKSSGKLSKRFETTLAKSSSFRGAAAR